MANKIKRLLAAAGLAMALCLSASAQQWSVQTNLVDYANFGTLNIEGGVAFGQHWSATAVAKLNPFRFTFKGEPVSARQQLFGADIRWWPWHVYSGWWAGTRLQFQEYNRGGINPKDKRTSEGDRYGLGLSGGYSYMINPHLNLDIGVGFWGGWDRYTTYSCPVCGLVLDKGDRAFILPNDILLALVYVF